LWAQKDEKKSTQTYLVVLASVFVSVVDADLAAIDAGVCANAEVVGHEGGAVSLQNDLALEEGTLGNARVGLLGLSDHD